MPSHDRSSRTQREAYLKPTVDPSDEPFTWGSVEIDGLRLFLKDSLGWNQDKVDNTMQPVLQALRDRQKGKANMQGSLERYFDTSAGLSTRRVKPKYDSAKLQAVIRKFRKDKAEAAGEEISASEEDSLKKKSKKSRKKKKKAATPTPEETEDEDNDESPAPPSRNRTSRAKKPTQVIQSEESELEVDSPPVVKPRRAPTPPLREPQTAAEKAIAHLPAPRKRSGIPQPGEKKAKAKPKRKLGAARTASEKRRHHIASDDSGWEDNAR